MAAATASVAGLKFDEFGALLSTMTRNGIKSHMAMTSVNAIMNAFLKPTDDARKAAKKYGITLNTETLRTEGLIGVMHKLKNAKVEDIALIFQSTRGIRGMAAALQDVTGFQTDLGMQISRTGEALTAQEKATDTLRHKLNQLSSAWDAFKVVIGDAFIEDLKELTEWLKARLPEALKTAKIWANQLKVEIIALLPYLKKTATVLQTIGWGISKTLAMMTPALAGGGLSANPLGIALPTSGQLPMPTTAGGPLGGGAGGSGRGQPARSADHQRHEPVVLRLGHQRDAGLQTGWQDGVGRL